jgi:hypothetical protein
MAARLKFCDASCLQYLQVLIAAAFIVAPSGSAAQTNAPVAVEKTRPANFAVSGNFSAVQIATTDANKLLAEWQKSTPGVRFETSAQMRKNQPIFTFIVFKGCTPDAAGRCNVTADFQMIDPAGKSYGEQKDTPVWVNLPPAPNYNLQLSSAYLGIVIENKDLTGPYEVRTAITDHVSGIILHTKETLTAIP